MPKHKLGHDKYSFTELCESLNEASADEKDRIIIGDIQKGLKNLIDVHIGRNWGKTSDKNLGRLMADMKSQAEKMLKELKSIRESASLDEDATANAKKSLDAIVGHLEKRKKSGADVLGATGRSMLKMGQGMQASYKQEGGFSPDQAKWIWKTSLALFK